MRFPGMRFVAAICCVLLVAPVAARAQVGGGGAPEAWVQIESQPTLAEARASARRYARELPDVNGFSVGRGWYGITLGPYTEDEARRVLEVYRREGVIARDSYIAQSSDYGRRFWPAGAQPFLLEPEQEPELPEVTEPEPERVVYETLREARAGERRLSRDERAELQVALQWAGFYDGRIDAAFGPGTRGAMAAWQRQNGFEPTGVLTTRQRAALMRQYNAVLADLGLETVRDARRASRSTCRSAWWNSTGTRRLSRITCPPARFPRRCC